jgi:hypothetical protein
MDFKNVLQMNRVDFQVDPSNHNEIKLCCLFCTDRGHTADTRYRLGVNVSKDVGHCFNCEFRTRSAFAAIATKLRIVDVVSKSAEPEPEVSVERLRMPSDFWPLWYDDHDDATFQDVYNYIRKRGVTRKQLLRHRIGFSLAGKMAYRIVFPIRYQKQLQMLVGRDYTGSQEPKYLNSRGPKPVFNPPAPETLRLVLSEGIFKALAIENVSEQHSAALLGHSMSDRQYDAVKDVPHISLFPDPDRAGMGVTGFLGVARALDGKGHKVYLPWPVPTKQADEYDASELSNILKTMTPYTHVLDQRYRVESNRR